jgi:hypothetical protein
MSLVRQAFGDDPIQGGTSIITFGSFGSGKSKLLQSWAIRDFEKGHLVILRSKDVDTWQDLSERYPIHVYTPDYYHFTFDDQSQNKNIKYTIIRRPDDIVQNLKRDEINIISALGSEFETGFFWSWFSKSLTHHHSKGWTTFLFDELRDVYQSHPSGDSFKVYESFVSALTSFRKKRIHFRASTHTFHDVYYEILYKFQYTVYLKGSILLPKKRTALETRTPIQEACNRETFILDNISEFETVHHSTLPPELATSQTVAIDGPDFSSSLFPLELLSMGIRPLVKCPECERSFHAISPRQSCPICKEEISLTDKIAKGTPKKDYDGENPPEDTLLSPLSIEEKTRMQVSVVGEGGEEREKERRKEKKQNKRRTKW